MTHERDDTQQPDDQDPREQRRVNPPEDSDLVKVLQRKRAEKAREQVREPGGRRPAPKPAPRAVEVAAHAEETLPKPTPTPPSTPTAEERAAAAEQRALHAERDLYLERIIGRAQLSGDPRVFLPYLKERVRHDGQQWIYDSEGYLTPLADLDGSAMSVMLDLSDFVQPRAKATTSAAPSASAAVLARRAKAEAEYLAAKKRADQSPGEDGLVGLAWGARKRLKGQGRSNGNQQPAPAPAPRMTEAQAIAEYGEGSDEHLAAMLEAKRTQRGR